MQMLRMSALTQVCAHSKRAASAYLEKILDLQLAIKIKKQGYALQNFIKIVTAYKSILDLRRGDC